QSLRAVKSSATCPYVAVKSLAQGDRLLNNEFAPKLLAGVQSMIPSKIASPCGDMQAILAKWYTMTNQIHNCLCPFVMAIALMLAVSPESAFAQSSHGGSIVPWINNLRPEDFPAKVKSIRLDLSKACNPCVIDSTQNVMFRKYWRVTFGSQPPTAKWSEAPWT